MNEGTRKIIHIDMDMFYAAVEIHDRPELRDLPVVVGGPPHTRSVVATANYVARRFGIRSGMASTEAERRCPSCVFLPPNFPRYRELSERIAALLRGYTPLVERVSLDEAYLDVTEDPRGIGSATKTARLIKEEISRVTGGLTSSAGVAPVMFVAKIASDYHKPNGLTIVTPERVLSFLHPLPVSKIPGVGPITAKHLAKLGIRTIGELFRTEEELLQKELGKFGRVLYDAARGRENRLVLPFQERLSLGTEETFPEDLTELYPLLRYLEKCSRDLYEGVRREEKRARRVTLKIKFGDFHQVTRSITLERFFRSPQEIFELAKLLLGRTEAGQRGVRLAGLSLSLFTPPKPHPLPSPPLFFPEES